MSSKRQSYWSRIASTGACKKEYMKLKSKTKTERSNPNKKNYTKSTSSKTEHLLFHAYIHIPLAQFKD
jgi:hypothetical protein